LQKSNSINDSFDALTYLRIDPHTGHIVDDHTSDIEMLESVKRFVYVADKDACL
jgi:hypothetical protein